STLFVLISHPLFLLLRVTRNLINGRSMPPGQLPASALKVAAAAERLGLAVTVREMTASTRTAEEAAAACGVTVGQIVKSLIFVGADSGRPYLLLVSGSNRVNEKSVAAHLGERLKRPDADAVRA